MKEGRDLDSAEMSTCFLPRVKNPPPLALCSEQGLAADLPGDELGAEACAVLLQGGG